MTTIKPSSFDFLKDLQANNNREWFAEHKARYEIAQQNMVEFAEELRDRMGEHDNIVPKSGKRVIMRIYRDVRFSKDKSPYKNHFGGGITRATEQLRGGYYFHIEPGASFAGGGFWSPDSPDLKRIRDEIAANDQPLRAILADKTFKKTFGGFSGDAVKTAPKGFSKEHPAIDLIRFKQFVVRRKFSDKEVLSKKFLETLTNTFLTLRPYFDYMSDVLTTDRNGVRLKD